MTAKAKLPISRLPLLAAILACLALAASLLRAPASTAEYQASGGTWWIISLLAGLAVVLLLTALVRRIVQLTRLGHGPWLGIASLVGLVLGMLWTIQVTQHSEYAALPGVASCAGWVLIAAGICRLTRAGTRTTPWQSLGGTGPSGGALYVVGPIVVGIGLLLVSLLATGSLLPGTLLNSTADGLGMRSLGLMVAVTITAIAVWVLAQATKSGPASAGVKAQQMGAHLHDSVLQELAVIRRKADDPEAVRTIARRTERDLRDWLSGSDAPAGSSFANAIKSVARQVEDEVPGAEVEVVGVRDVGLDARTDALVAATREAIRNAVRHGASPANVFTEVAADGSTTVFVRDTGPGFDVDDVPNERRGVRDAIIGRMQSVGGSAEIESGSEGTEVTLRLPPAKADPA